MYNFNTSLSTPLMGVGVEFCSNTPRTPEILNSLIAMTNPFEYSYSSASSQSQSIPSTASIMNVDTSPVIACKTEDSFMNQQYDTSSSSSSLESPSTTPLHMISSYNGTTTPSLQQTRSQLIKAGVKLLIQNKRKNSGSSNFDYDCKPPPLKIRPTTLSSPITTTAAPTAIATTTRLNSSSSIPSSSDTVPSPTSTLTSPKQETTSPISVRSFPIKTDDTSSCDEDDSEPKQSVNRKNLTPEDEDRRRRRRERNKIAATKCRLKKRECINNLMRESEMLETQNVDLKTQLKSLEEEYKYLNEMWQSHQLECKSMATATPMHEQNNNSNHSGSIASLIEEIEMIKDTNNNKHLHNQDQNCSQLPSLTPLINCNVSFDFY